MTQKNQSPEAFNPTTAEIRTCLGTDQEQNIDCWYERLEAMIAQNDTTDSTFEDIKAASSASGYVHSNCHQIAHIIGRAAGKKYSDVAAAYQDGDSFCWSGYYHGVMEAVATTIGKEEIVSQINEICKGLREENQYSFNHYNCVHGLGHGLMQVQKNELFIALKTCDGLSDSWEQTSCHGGVFMENVMNNINPDHTVTYLKNDDPLYPCNVVELAYKQQCYLMQTSHALTVLGHDFARVFELCGTVEEPYNTTCFQSLGRDASGRYSSNVEKTIELCELGGDYNARNNCYIGAVKDFISYYSSDTEAIALCNAITQSEIKETCLLTAESYYKTF